MDRSLGEVSADELLGLKPPTSNPAAEILRRIQQLEELPSHDQKAILKHIDALTAAHKSKGKPTPRTAPERATQHNK